MNNLNYHESGETPACPQRGIASEPTGARGRIGRFLAGLRNIIFVVAASLTVWLGVLYLFVGDSNPLGEYFTIWPPFLWLFVLLPLAAVTFERSRFKRNTVLLALVILFLLLCCEWRSLVVFRSRSYSKRDYPSFLRVVSWNVSGCDAGEKAILDELERLQPDVCFLQESPNTPTFQQEAKRHAYWKDAFYVDDGDCAVLSLSPIHRESSASIGPWSAPQILLADLSSSKSMMLVNVRLMLPSLILCPFSEEKMTQFVSDSMARNQQFRDLADLIESKKSKIPVFNVILAGDFNTPGGIQSLKPLRRILKDVWPVCGEGWGATITSSFPVSRIDQCWVSSGIRPLSAKVKSTRLSDHRILVVELLMSP